MFSVNTTGLWLVNKESASQLHIIARILSSGLEMLDLSFVMISGSIACKYL